MKKIVFGVCLGFALLSASSISAQDEATDKPDEVEVIKKSDFLQAQRIMFNAADKDFDGQVSQGEINLLNDDLNKPKHLKAFKALDTDNNGFLSLREIEAKHQEFADNNIARFETRKAQLLRLYDQDGDGDISSREIDSYFEKSADKSSASTLKSATADLKGKDADGSGSVSLEEYMSSKTAVAVQKSREARRKGEYIRRDKDGDRIIKRSENEVYSVRLFELLDKNQDNQLSMSEQSDRAYKSSQRFSLSSTYVSSSPVGTLQ